MKKMMSFMLIFFFIVNLTACSLNPQKGPSGKYIMYKDNVEMGYLDFNGKTVRIFMGMEAQGVVVFDSVASYTIENGNIECTYEDGGHDSFSYDETTDTISIWGGAMNAKKTA